MEFAGKEQKSGFERGLSLKALIQNHLNILCVG